MPPITTVPRPATIEAAAETASFVLDAATTIGGDADASSALTSLIAARTGISVGTSAGGAAGRIDLRVADDGAGKAESYTLTVTDISVTIVGADAAGLFYGIQTLTQLIRRDGDRWSIPAVTIEDAPRFAYRGVMLDIARHFHSVETVCAYIDRAAALKLNVLHLHLTDDQGWRIHIDSRPELTARASSMAIGGDPGGFFTKADYARIVAHAASRHMTVVPEIDVPGHTHAVGLAYPELAEAPVLGDEVLQTVAEFGGGIPTPGEPYEGLAVGFSSLRIHEEATYDFLADVFGELAAMTPGPYLHIGGDECLGTPPEDFAAFIARATAIVADLGKTPMTWHEAGAASGIHPSTVGQYWGYVQPTDGMDENVRAFVHHGSRVILSPSDAVYLDMKFDADSALGLTWANGVTTLERAYAWEPASLIDGVGEDDILGVEAPLWGETVRTIADIDAMAFPRIAAAAEVAWSPPAGRSWEDFRARVGGLGPLWQAAGIGFTPLAEVDWAQA